MKETERINKIMSVVDWFDYYNSDTNEMSDILRYFIENPKYIIEFDVSLKNGNSKVVRFKNKEL